MPAKSPEALERKKRRRKERQTAARVTIHQADLPGYKIAARRMLPRIGEMTKAELREMLAQAVANTARQ